VGSVRSAVLFGVLTLSLPVYTPPDGMLPRALLGPARKSLRSQQVVS